MSNLIHNNIILHQGADLLTTDGRDLAGGILHYARLEDAAKNHKFVRSVLGYRLYAPGNQESWHYAHFDFLGHKFEQVRA